MEASTPDYEIDIQEAWITLPDGVRLAAAHVGIFDRGVIMPTMKADLVLFNPDTVLDRATPESPQTLSVGIEQVWVNGEVVFKDGETTGRRPGEVIRR